MDGRAFDLSTFRAIAADPVSLPVYWGNIRCCQEMGAEYAADTGAAVQPPTVAVYLAKVREALD